MDYAQHVYSLVQEPNIKVTYGNFQHLLTNDQISTWTHNEQTFYSNHLVPEAGKSPTDFEHNLAFIRNNIAPNTKLIILNGCEVASPNPNEQEHFKRHKELNEVVDRFVLQHNNTELLDVRKLVLNQQDLADNIRHYQRNIYYLLAKELQKILEIDTMEVSKKKFFLNKLKRKIINKISLQK